MTAPETIRRALACANPGCECQRPTGNVHCPAHEDREPSLSVNVEGEKLLFHCHAGCSQKAVLASLRQRGLWHQPANKVRESKLSLVLFKDAEDTRPEPQTLTWSQLTDLLTTHKERSAKDGAAWSPAIYRPNARRGNRSVTALTAAVGDFDDGTPWEQVKTRLKGLAFIAHSTYSHTKYRAKYRVIVPFAHPVSVDEWGVVRTRIEAHLFGGKADPATKDPARLYYLPSCPAGAECFAESQEGPFLDPGSLPKATGPVEDAASLIEDVSRSITRFVVVPADVVVALALWVLHTHAFEAAAMTPYLHVTSAEKQSGKTRLLEVLALLVPRPWHVTRVTVAALFRRIEKECPTLLLDESDASFNREAEFGESLRQVLNDGYRLNGRSTVVVGQGANMTTQDFSVFCPKVIAGLREIPDTIADRSIRIEMKRRAPNEPVEKFRQRKAGQDAAPLRQCLERWADQTVQQLESAEPEIPDGLSDRASDIWEPLLAIADLAGAGWPERARQAALSLSAISKRQDNSLGVRLLGDVQTVLEERRLDRISSAELVTALVSVDESPWGDLRGKPLDARGLAWRLRAYGPRTKNVRLADGSQTKGYERADFEDAWRRYLPIYPSQPSHGTDSDSRLGTDGTDGTGYSSTGHLIKTACVYCGQPVEDGGDVHPSCLEDATR